MQCEVLWSEIFQAMHVPFESNLARRLGLAAASLDFIVQTLATAFDVYHVFGIGVTFKA
jgi:hypothetical protein